MALDDGTAGVGCSGQDHASAVNRSVRNPFTVAGSAACPSVAPDSPLALFPVPEVYVPFERVLRRPWSGSVRAPCASPSPLSSSREVGIFEGVVPMSWQPDRYPPDWKSITARIRDRDGNACKFCGVPNGAFIVRNRRHPERFVIVDAHTADILRANGMKVVRVTLTVAHLIEGGPLQCPDSDLAALCNRCHLVYDLQLHVRNAKRTRRRRRIAAGQLELEQAAVAQWDGVYGMQGACSAVVGSVAVAAMRLSVAHGSS
jgi:hypothetical protein